MTNKEAIMLLNPKTTASALAEIEYYNGFRGKEACIEAIEDACRLAIEALEKQIPKKPHITIMGCAYSDHKRTITNCPYCYEVKGLGLWESLIDRPTPYCRRCGQAIDWSEVEQ